MTTPARRAAYFQLRSSNILVAPLDAPGVHPGRYLVVYRAGPRADLLRRDASSGLPAEQHDLVPDLDRPVNPEDAGVHRNPSQERPARAPDKGLRPPRERPPVPLGVPDRNRRHEHRGVGLEGQPVGYPITRSQPPHIGDVALEHHRWQEPFPGYLPPVSGRVEAVESHAGTHAIVARVRMPEGG